MWQDALSLIWIFLPAGLANTGPVIANNIPLLKRFHQPLDFHRTWRGKRVFGDHKTVRGVVSGMIVGMLVAGLQMGLVSLFPSLNTYSLSVVDYGSALTLLMGLCMGFGALAGDAIKSFFKRQIDIAPGKNWVPFDQLDFVVGGMIASWFFFVLPIQFYVLGVLVGLILHPLANILGWIFKLQDSPF